MMGQDWLNALLLLYATMMGQDWLNALLLLYAHKTIGLCYDDEIYARPFPKRMTFINPLAIMNACLILPPPSKSCDLPL